MFSERATNRVVSAHQQIARLKPEISRDVKGMALRKHIEDIHKIMSDLFMVGLFLSTIAIAGKNNFQELESTNGEIFLCPDVWNVAIVFCVGIF